MRQCRTQAAALVSAVSLRNAGWACSIRRAISRAGTGTVRPLTDEPDGNARHSSAWSAAAVFCHSSDRKMNGTPDKQVFGEDAGGGQSQVADHKLGRQ